MTDYFGPGGLRLHITLLMVLDGFENIVERFGPEHTAVRSDGHVGCLYMEDGTYYGAVKPVCIVGQFFADLGILRLLTALHGGGDPLDTGVCNLANFGADVVEHLTQFGVTIDTDASDFMRAAQRRQDRGSTWAVAFNDTVTETNQGLGIRVQTATQLLRQSLS